MFEPLPTASMAVRQLFEQTVRFMVPIYQRPYSWTVEEAGQLLEDVATAAGIDEGQQLEPDYFLGAILLLDTAAATNGPNAGAAAADELEIVDGLQRLVTLTILACALRDLEPDAQSRTARLLDGLVRRVDLPLADSSRIELRSDEWRIVFDLVVAPGGCLRGVPDDEQLETGQQAIIDARDRIVEDLGQFTLEQRRSLSDYICEKCHFVVVKTRDIDRAHRIFMVLNDRGRPLQKKDILKAEILRAIEPAHRDAALAVWRDVEARLGAELENFLSHLRAVHGYQRMQIIAGVRRIVAEAGSARKFVHEILGPTAEAYAMILSAKEPGAGIPEQVRRALVRLMRLKGSEWVPAALQILMRRPPPDLAREYLEEIERASFLMRLVCLGSNKRLTRFAKITKQLSEQRLPAPTTLYDPPREELRAVAFNLRDLHARNVQACKGLLMRINDELQPDAVYADPADYTVEHVLPQRPKTSSLWRKWYPDPEERVALTASLGNLVLVSQRNNGLARNEEFLRKKEIYGIADPAVPSLAISGDILDADVWLPDQIRAREAKLISLMNRIWRLDIEVAPLEEPVG